MNCYVYCSALSTSCFSGDPTGYIRGTIKKSCFSSREHGENPLLFGGFITVNYLCKKIMKKKNSELK